MPGQHIAPDNLTASPTHDGDVHQSESPPRVAELDGLRALAIRRVVAWHYLGAGAGPDSVWWRIFIVERTGVDLFFVLSDYLITCILLNNVGAFSFFSTFCLHRSFRIFPINFRIDRTVLLAWIRYLRPMISKSSWGSKGEANGFSSAFFGALGRRC